jgi:predicted DNA-binding protein (UPF0278 family)
MKRCSINKCKLDAVYIGYSNGTVQTSCWEHAFEMHNYKWTPLSIPLSSKEKESMMEKIKSRLRFFNDLKENIIAYAVEVIEAISQSANQALSTVNKIERYFEDVLRLISSSGIMDKDDYYDMLYDINEFNKGFITANKAKARISSDLDLKWISSYKNADIVLFSIKDLKKWDIKKKAFTIIKRGICSLVE